MAKEQESYLYLEPLTIVIANHNKTSLTTKTENDPEANGKTLLCGINITLLQGERLLKFSDVS